MSVTVLNAQATVFPASAGDIIFRAGAVSFSFPSPSNDLVEPGSDYRVLFEPLAPASNRLVAAFIPSADLKTAVSGTFPSLQKYALIEVPRRAEFATADADVFKQVVDAMDKQFAGDLTGTVQEQQDEVNRRLKSLGSSNTVTIEKPILLGSWFSKPNAYGYGMILPITGKDGSMKMAAGLSVIRAHNRVLFAYLYSVYKDESTVTGLKIATEEWANAILNANR